MRTSAVININGERMVWDYPDITFAQIHFLATGKWRQIRPKLNINYTLKRPSGTVDAGDLSEDQVIKVTLDGELKINTSIRPGTMIRCNYCTSANCDCK